MFPTSTGLWAPLWVGERAVTSWIALGARARGGVRYAGIRLPRAATASRVLRRRHALVRTSGSGRDNSASSASTRRAKLSSTDSG